MARPLQETARSKRSVASKKAAPAVANPHRQRMWRDIALILIAPLLFYLLASLGTFSPADPGWSHSGSITAPLHNVGGRVGAWLADVLLYLTGYVAYLLPVMLGLVAWIALFGKDPESGTEADLGPVPGHRHDPLRASSLAPFGVVDDGCVLLEKPHGRQD